MSPPGTETPSGLGWTGWSLLGVVRSHWGIEHNGVRTLEMDWQEERAWCTQGAATDVPGWLRLWADNLGGLLKGRYLRSPRRRRLTLGGFVQWLEPVSLWADARRDRRRVVPARSSQRARGQGCRPYGTTIGPSEPAAGGAVCPRLTADRPPRGAAPRLVPRCRSLGRSSPQPLALDNPLSGVYRAKAA